jgi:hypothetical protein
MAFVAPAWAQVAPGDPNGDCSPISTDPAIRGFTITTQTTGIYGPRDNRVRVEFNPAGIQIVRWEVLSQPGKPINSVILAGASGQVSTFNIVPDGAFQSVSPAVLPGATPPAIKTTTFCFGEADVTPTEVVPKCQAVPGTVLCAPGFNGAVLVTAEGQRLIETICTCGTTELALCSAVDLTAPNACVSRIGPIKEVPDEALIINGSLLYCTVTGGTRKCYTIR